MRDGFDSNVAKRMPTKNGARPNRPWNVDPIQLKTQEEELASPEAALAAEPVAAPEIVCAQPVVPLSEPRPVVETIVAAPQAQISVEGAAEALSTLEEINSEFSNLLFERKDIQGQLRQQQQALDALTAENARLQASLEEMQTKAVDGRRVNQEIVFLNEQLQDAEAYIQNLASVLDERSLSLAAESRQRAELQDRLGRITAEVQSKAKLDVKVMILERDLKTATGRVSQLEGELEQEYRKRQPLETEIGELKHALDKVHSSLAQIRLKAKREVYGS